jgi:hypothetical protein
MSGEQRFRHTPDMGEISGFGAGYEECCQDMLEAGVKWLDRKKQAGTAPGIEGHSYKGVYGVMVPDSADAKELSDVICKAATRDGQNPERGATGAMHQAVMARLFFIDKNGWDKYRAELRAHEASGGDKP